MDLFWSGCDWLNPNEDTLIWQPGCDASGDYELVFEAVEEKADEYKTILETEMKEAAMTILNKVPVKCDANVAESWAEK